MARIRKTYWKCVESKWGNLIFRRWAIYDRDPSDKDAEIYDEFPDKEYRPLIKGLPRFVPNKVYEGVLAFIPISRFRKKKKE